MLESARAFWLWPSSVLNIPPKKNFKTRKQTSMVKKKISLHFTCGSVRLGLSVENQFSKVSNIKKLTLSCPSLHLHIFFKWFFWSLTISSGKWELKFPFVCSHFLWSHGLTSWNNWKIIQRQGSSSMQRESWPFAPGKLIFCLIWWIVMYHLR